MGRKRGESASARKRVFATQIAAGLTQKEAADKLGVAHSTAIRWMQDPEVIDRVEQFQRDAVQDALEMMREAAGEAVSVVLEHVKNERDLRAALALLDRVGLGPGAKLDVHAKHSYADLSDEELAKKLIEAGQQLAGEDES